LIDRSRLKAVAANIVSTVDAVDTDCISSNTRNHNNNTGSSVLCAAGVTKETRKTRQRTDIPLQLYAQIPNLSSCSKYPSFYGNFERRRLSVSFLLYFVTLSLCLFLHHSL